MRIRRVIWPLLSKKVLLPVMRESFIAGWAVPLMPALQHQPG
jgi:hypothetical protein